MRRLIVLFFLPFVILDAHAATFDVCTESDLRSAINSAKAGDEIVMCSRKWKNLDLLFEVRGKEDAPITLRAESPGKTILTGRSQIRMAGEYAVVKGLRFQDGYPSKAAIEFRRNSSVHCNHCRLTETSIIDYDPPRSSADWDIYRFYVRLHGKYNRVDHNYFTGKHGRGQVMFNSVTSDGPERHRVDHNFFGPRDKHPSGNHAEAIKQGNEAAQFFTSGTIIEDNYFYRSNGEFEVISVKTSGVILRRNTFDRCEGVLSLRLGNNSWVDANTFLGHRDPSKRVSGIRVRGNGHVISNNYLSGIKVGGSQERGGISLASGEGPGKSKDSASDILIVFNTIVDSDRSIGADTKRPVHPKNIVIANNIVSSPFGPLVADAATIENVSFSNNLMYGAKIGVNSSGIIEADPKLEFVNGFHRISSSSPAVDGADNRFTPMSIFGSGALFIDGEEQSRSGAYDIGADEYVQGVGIGHTRICDTGPRSYEAVASRGCIGSSYVAPKPPRLLSDAQ